MTWGTLTLFRWKLPTIQHRTVAIRKINLKCMPTEGILNPLRCQSSKCMRKNKSVNCYTLHAVIFARKKLLNLHSLSFPFSFLFLTFGFCSSHLRAWRNVMPVYELWNLVCFDGILDLKFYSFDYFRISFYSSYASYRNNFPYWSI